jgi:hypothetical protein
MNEEVIRFKYYLTDSWFIVFIVVKALEDVEPPKKIIVSAPPPQAATRSKRKSFAVDGDEDAEGDSDNDNGEGYNTRYKGVKRVRVHGYSPEPPEVKPKRKVVRPRKSASAVEGRKRGRPRKDVLTLGEQIKVSKRKAKSLENGDTVISRPIGRLRKVVAVSNGVPESAKKPRQSVNAPKSMDNGREIFDGIVLVKRSKNGKEKAVGDDDGDGDGDRDGDGDGDGEGDGEAPNDERDGTEEDAVLAAVNGDAQGELSSLGGSNKGEDKISLFSEF